MLKEHTAMGVEEHSASVHLIDFDMDKSRDKGSKFC